MIIDLTIAEPSLASRIGDWCVLEVITLSDAQCIEFSIQELSHPVNVGRGSKVRSPSWNTKRLSKDKLREHLEETRLTIKLRWARSAGSLEDTVWVARQEVVARCEHSMSRCGHGRSGDSMYWWNHQLSFPRGKCFRAWRRFTRSKGDPLLREAWKEAKSDSIQFSIQCWPSSNVEYSIRQNAHVYCGSLVANAERTLFVCSRWGAEREAVGRTVGAQLTPDTMVPLMLQSEQI